MEESIRNAIRIVSLNILLGLIRGIEAALHALQKVNMGIGVLQEMNLEERIYMWQSASYSLRVMGEDIRHRDGIAFMW